MANQKVQHWSLSKRTVSNVPIAPPPPLALAARYDVRPRTSLRQRHKIGAEECGEADFGGYSRSISPKDHGGLVSVRRVRWSPLLRCPMPTTPAAAGRAGSVRSSGEKGNRLRSVRAPLPASRCVRRATARSPSPTAARARAQARSCASHGTSQTKGVI